MPKKWLGILAVLAVIVLGALLAGCGGSSDHSSEWNSYDVGKAESNVAEELSSSGLTPTKGQTECIVNGLKSSYSPSEVYEDTPSADDKEKIEDLTTECVEDDSGDSSSEEPYEEDYEYQNEGLNELNEERQEEIQEEIENGEVEAP